MTYIDELQGLKRLLLQQNKQFALNTSLDILAISAHPDDIEISAGGSILKSISLGQRVGILDLTGGEMGSRGSLELRLREAEEASKLMGLHSREILGLKDCFFEHNQASILAIIEKIRQHRPQIILCTAPSDRHPDHGRASKLIKDACFYSGLKKIETTRDGKPQEHWRPRAVYHYIQDRYLEPDFVVDVTEFWERKIEVLKCFGSQFHDPNTDAPETPISGAEFFDFLKGRALQMGRPAGFILAEGFIAERTPGISNLSSLI